MSVSATACPLPAGDGNATLGERDTILQLLDTVVQAWASGDWDGAAACFAPHATLASSQHGLQRGASAIGTALRRDLERAPHLRLQTSNHYIGGADGLATVSAYLFGELRASPLFPGMLFSASLVLELTAAPRRVQRLRLAIDWVEGEAELVPHWNLAPGDSGWRMPPRLPLLASKLDLPWPHVRDFSLAGSAQDSAMEVFSRYAWALDQGDFALLASCFTEDALADFQPVGQVRGRQAVVSKLKAYCCPQPWLQHFGDVLTVAVDETGLRATMLVGRIVPRHAFGPDGLPIYSAHYRMRLRRDHDLLWKLAVIEYCPGWVHAHQLEQLCARAGMTA